jgi:hypothetical protein
MKTIILANFVGAICGGFTKAEVRDKSRWDVEDSINLYKTYQGEANRLARKIIKYRIAEFVQYRIKGTIIRVVAFIAILAFSKFVIFDQLYPKIKQSIVYMPSPAQTKTIVVEDAKKSHDAFLDGLAKFESSGKYECYKEAGDYWGRYQMGPIARQAIGIDKIARQDFLSNHKLQDGVVTALMQLNKKHLAPYIGKYEGKTVNGIYVTQSGLLAGAHLGGAQSVINWLESNGLSDFADGNGTHITKYIKAFSGYKLNL